MTLERIKPHLNKFLHFIVANGNTAITVLQMTHYGLWKIIMPKATDIIKRFGYYRWVFANRMEYTQD